MLAAPAMVLALHGGEAIAADAPPAAATPAASTAAVHLTVHSLVFLASRSAVKPKGISVSDGVDASAVAFLQDPEFAKRLQPYLGKPVTADLLQEVSNQTVLFAREKNYPVVDVSVPEQDISGGRVQILVLVGRLGQVRVDGNRWFDGKDIAAGIRMKPGDPIRSDLLRDDLAWINNNPFRSVDAVFQPGSEPGTTDIVLKTTDRFPVRVSGGYANNGTPATTRGRLNAGLSWGDAFWLGHRLDYQYSRSVVHGPFEANSLSYGIPLPWRDSLTFSVSRAVSHATSAGTPFTTKGIDDVASMRYGIPLPRFDVLGGLTHEFAVGAEHKKSNSNLQFGGTQVFATAPEVNQATLSYYATLLDGFGSTGLFVDGYISPGDIGSNNTTAIFRQAQAGSDAHYLYGRLRLERVVNLPAGLSLFGRGTAQRTTANLLPSEKLLVGGANSVRGYDEAQFAGDSGYLASVELRSPPFNVIPATALGGAADQFQALLFYDYGITGPFRREPGSDKTLSAASVGMGVRYAIEPYLSMRFDYGVQLHAHTQTGTQTGPETRRDGADFVLTIGY